MDSSHLFKVSVQERQEELFSGVYRRVQRRDSEVKDKGGDRKPLGQSVFFGRQGHRKSTPGQSAEETPEAVLYNAKGRIVGFGQSS